MKFYFKVVLTDGECLDFNKKCDKVIFDDPNYAVFGYRVENGYIVLAIIPHKSIYKIVSMNYSK